MKESPEKDFSQNVLPSNVPISNPLQLRGRERESVHSRFVMQTDLFSLVLRPHSACYGLKLTVLTVAGSNASAYLRVDALHSGT